MEEEFLLSPLPVPLPSALTSTKGEKHFSSFPYPSVNPSPTSPSSPDITRLNFDSNNTPLKSNYANEKLEIEFSDDFSSVISGDSYKSDNLGYLIFHPRDEKSIDDYLNTIDQNDNELETESIISTLSSNSLNPIDYKEIKKEKQPSAPLASKKHKKEKEFNIINERLRKFSLESVSSFVDENKEKNDSIFKHFELKNLSINNNESIDLTDDNIKISELIFLIIRKVYLRENFLKKLKKIIKKVDETYWKYNEQRIKETTSYIEKNEEMNSLNELMLENSNTPSSNNNNNKRSSTDSTQLSSSISSSTNSNYHKETNLLTFLHCPSLTILRNLLIDYINNFSVCFAHIRSLSLELIININKLREVINSEVFNNKKDNNIVQLEKYCECKFNQMFSETDSNKLCDCHINKLLNNNNYISLYYKKQNYLLKIKKDLQFLYNFQSFRLLSGYQFYSYQYYHNFFFISSSMLNYSLSNLPLYQLPPFFNIPKTSESNYSSASSTTSTQLFDSSSSIVSLPPRSSYLFNNNLNIINNYTYWKEKNGKLLIKYISKYKDYSIRNKYKNRNQNSVIPSIIASSSPKISNVKGIAIPTLYKDNKKINVMVEPEYEKDEVDIDNDELKQNSEDSDNDSIFNTIIEEIDSDEDPVKIISKSLPHAQQDWEKLRDLCEKSWVFLEDPNNPNIGDWIQDDSFSFSFFNSEPLLHPLIVEAALGFYELIHGSTPNFPLPYLIPPVEYKEKILNEYKKAASTIIMEENFLENLKRVRKLLKLRKKQYISKKNNNILENFNLKEKINEFILLKSRQQGNSEKLKGISLQYYAQQINLDTKNLNNQQKFLSDLYGKEYCFDDDISIMSGMNESEVLDSQLFTLTSVNYDKNKSDIDDSSQKSETSVSSFLSNSSHHSNYLLPSSFNNNLKKYTNISKANQERILKKKSDSHSKLSKQPIDEEDSNKSKEFLLIVNNSNKIPSRLSENWLDYNAILIQKYARRYIIRLKYFYYKIIIKLKKLIKDYINNYNIKIKNYNFLLLKKVIFYKKIILKKKNKLRSRSSIIISRFFRWIVNFKRMTEVNPEFSSTSSISLISLDQLMNTNAPSSSSSINSSHNATLLPTENEKQYHIKPLLFDKIDFNESPLSLNFTYIRMKKLLIMHYLKFHSFDSFHFNDLFLLISFNINEPYRSLLSNPLYTPYVSPSTAKKTNQSSDPYMKPPVLKAFDFDNPTESTLIKFQNNMNPLEEANLIEKQKNKAKNFINKMNKTKNSNLLYNNLRNSRLLPQLKDTTSNELNSSKSIDSFTKSNSSTLPESLLNSLSISHTSNSSQINLKKINIRKLSRKEKIFFNFDLNSPLSEDNSKNIEDNQPKSLLKSPYEVYVGPNLKEKIEKKREKELINEFQLDQSSYHSNSFKNDIENNFQGSTFSHSFNNIFDDSSTVLTNNLTISTSNSILQNDNKYLKIKNEFNRSNPSLSSIKNFNSPNSNSLMLPKGLNSAHSSSMSSFSSAGKSSLSSLILPQIKQSYSVNALKPGESLSFLAPKYSAESESLNEILKKYK